MNLDGKTILITGSTDGVGRVVALRLAEAGAEVLVHGRDPGRGESLLAEMRVRGNDKGLAGGDPRLRSNRRAKPSAPGCPDQQCRAGQRAPAQ